MNEHGPQQKLVVVVNENVTMSRGKYAAQAVHAALLAAGAHHGGPVVVLGGSEAEVRGMPETVRDAGRTELTPGTLTAGACWLDARERWEPPVASPHD
jgi:PTH2 family peptidyl-tRNA hydrolase